MATTHFKGTAVNTNAELPAVGSTAADFQLIAGDLSEKGLADFAGKKKILNIVPSLDTPVCAASARRFNEEAAKLDAAVVLVISADLPFAQGRFCTAEGLKDVVPLSMMRDRKFAADYGVLLIDGPLAGLTARAVIAVDADNRVTYVQLVDEITVEPDYAAALKAIA